MQEVVQIAEMCCTGGAATDCISKKPQSQLRLQPQVQVERDIQPQCWRAEGCRQLRLNRKKKGQATLAHMSFLGLTWLQTVLKIRRNSGKLGSFGMAGQLF